MPAGTRKSHKKSHNGCGQCKRRRIKCDETPPICSNCRKKGIQCDFAVLAKTFILSSGHSSRADYNSTKLAQDLDHGVVGHEDILTMDLRLNETSAQTSPENLFQLRDLELMHHYSTCTALTISPTDDLQLQYAWTVALPQEAGSHRYLMHSLLAISALHFAHTKPQSRALYLALGQAHRSRALSLFRSTVTDLNETNCAAIFGFSAFTTIFAYALPRIKPLEYQTEPVDALIEVITLVRGAWSLVQSAWPCLLTASVSPLINQKKAFEHMQLPPSVVEAMDQLAVLNESCTVDRDEKKVCAVAISSLRESFSITCAGSITWATSLRWPVLMSSDFLSLLQKRHPMALVMLAYYCILLNRGPIRWFSEECPQRVINVISRALPLELEPAMRWPLEQMMSWETYSDFN